VEEIDAKGCNWSVAVLTGAVSLLLVSEDEVFLEEWSL